MHGKKLNILVAAALGLASCLTAIAAQASPLRDALEKAPLELIKTPGPYSAYFLDLDTMRAMSRAQPAFQPISRISDPFGTNTLQAFSMDDAAEWTRYTGLAADEPASFLITPDAASETEVTRWRFTQASRTDTFLQGLQKRGFHKVGSEWRNGTPDLFDPAKDNLKEPFSGSSGFAVILKRSGDDVLQLRKAHAAATADKPHSLAMLPPIQTALDVLEKATKNATVPQIYVASLFMWTLHSSQLEQAFLDSIKDNPTKIDIGRIEKGTPGIPPTAGAIIADVQLQQPARHGVMFVFAYNDCTTAKKAGDTFLRLWRTAPNEHKSTARADIGTDATAAVAHTNAACSAIITIASPDAVLTAEAGKGSNPILRYILGAIARRDFTPLGNE